MKKFLRKYILPPLIRLVLRFVNFTSKTKINGIKTLREYIKKGPVIIALWHGDLAVVVYFYYKYFVKKFPVSVLVSPSEDGVMLGRVIKGFGGGYDLGDSRKSPVRGLITMIRRIKKDNMSLVFALDGPLGPVYTAKPGAVQCSKKTGAPIFCITASAKKAIRPKNAWDKFFLPKPFTKIYVEISEPFIPVEDTQSENLKLEKIINKQKQRCDEKAGVK